MNLNDIRLNECLQRLTEEYNRKNYGMGLLNPIRMKIYNLYHKNGFPDFNRFEIEKLFYAGIREEWETAEKRFYKKLNQESVI